MFQLPRQPLTTTNGDLNLRQSKQIDSVVRFDIQISGQFQFTTRTAFGTLNEDKASFQFDK